MKDAPRTVERANTRKHSAGETTRIALLEAAEQLFATRGLDAVTSREIQVAARQSNSSVIGYHFGSREGLIRALVEYRLANLDADREALLHQMRIDGTEADPRAVVWLLVRPLANSIRAGHMFVPFLARLSENPEARSMYWPPHLDDPWSSDRMEEPIEAALQDLPERVRRGRIFQLYNSVLNLLGTSARTHGVSEAQLHNYVDGWVGMLTAPISYETRGLLTD
ncbi:TetR family transcriptional regulator [Nocardia sp. NPDC005366]|uniref:TetR/AcrR family transcriptional regulator n=1 Tax=Nocardia sp. NPDC005366 TaxID=3156878 RepID=UPI0033B16147